MLSSVIQHRAAGHMDYADHLKVSGMCCMSSCMTGVPWSKCYQRCSVLPSRILNNPQEFKGSVCPQARRNEADAHAIRYGLRKMGWLPSRFAKWESETKCAALDHAVSGAPLPTPAWERLLLWKPHSLHCFHCFNCYCHPCNYNCCDMDQ